MRVRFIHPATGEELECLKGRTIAYLVIAFVGMVRDPWLVDVQREHGTIVTAWEQDDGTPLRDGFVAAYLGGKYGWRSKWPGESLHGIGTKVKYD